MEHTTQNTKLVLQELKDFKGELAQVMSSLDDDSDKLSTEEKVKKLHDGCTELSMRFPSLFTEHQVGCIMAGALLKKLIVPFDFSKHSMLNFDVFLAARNLMTIGSNQEDPESYKQRNKVFM